MTDDPARPAPRKLPTRLRRWWWLIPLAALGAWTAWHFGKTTPPPPPPTATAELADIARRLTVPESLGVAELTQRGPTSCHAGLTAAGVRYEPLNIAAPFMNHA